jgi:uncharacterized protein YbjT (DUF2867 family)
MGKKVIITGTTGMVGGLVLRECLNSPEIESVVSFSRRSTGLNEEKLTEILLSDFIDYQNLEKHFTNVDIAFFCIGVYTGSVKRNEFRTITVDYTIAFGKMLKIYSSQATFCFLSGAGADQSEKSRMMFAQDKGAAENFLISQQFGALYIFRPGYIYPVTPRIEPNFSYRLSRKLYPVLKALMPKNVITSKHLAHAIFKTGLSGNNKTILENKNILDVT